MKCGFSKPKTTVAELFAGERAHVAARGGKHCMTGGGVPFHCPSETRIEVGLACGYETEFERTAGLSRVDDLARPTSRASASASPCERLATTVKPSAGTVRTLRARIWPSRHSRAFPSPAPA